MLTGRRLAGTPIIDLAADADVAGGRMLEPGDHAHQGGLAAAGGPEDREELAGRDAERHVVDGRMAAEALGDVDDVEIGGGVSGVP